MDYKESYRTLLIKYRTLQTQHTILKDSVTDLLKGLIDHDINPPYELCEQWNEVEELLDE